MPETLAVNNKDQFQKLAAALTTLGENRDEFDFWLKIFDYFEDAKQRELIGLMQDELKQLERIKK